MVDDSDSLDATELLDHLGQLWARIVPEVQISYEKWTPGGLYFFNIFWRDFMVLKVCMILMTNFFLYMYLKVNN